MPVSPTLSALFRRVSWLLAPAAGLYGAAVWTRGKLYDWGVLRSRSFPVPVICVGNLSAGGTGKTPHVEYVLRLLHGKGFRVASLSRGYRRQTRGFLLYADGVTSAEIGDEPYQIAQNCPFAAVAVCEDRAKGIERLLAQEKPPQVIVMDDGFQHRRVRAGLYVLLTDAARLYTRDRLLPWGLLREPRSGCRRADAVVVTKCAPGERPPLAVEARQGLYYSHIAYAPLLRTGGAASAETADCKGRRVLLFTGIARPEPLRRHIEASGGEVAAEIAFTDHHAFTPADLRRLEQAFVRCGAELAVTTQKDAARLGVAAADFAPRLWDALCVQPIEVAVERGRDDEKTFNQLITDYVDKNKRDGGVD